MHEHFLMAALKQAQLGRGLCAPNPSVGAVAVQNNQIIAQAWHPGAGKDHAEVLTLSQFPAQTPDVTLYVTLEPCNHWGRTPPCVDAIVQHGITTVVYAYADPNPVVSQNNTPEWLRAQGVQVIHYPLEVINRFYESYHYWMKTNLPFVTVKAAQTLDGKIAHAGGGRVEISNASCAHFTHQQRQAADVILTTSQTVLHDDPELNVRLNGTTEGKPIALLDRQLRVPHTARIFQSATQVHIYHHVLNSVLQGLYHAMPLKNDQLDLQAVLSHLGSIGYHDVFVEAGGELFRALHEAHLVNRTYLYVAPKLLGETAMPLYTQPTWLERSHKAQWTMMSDNARLQLDWLEGE